MKYLLSFILLCLANTDASWALGDVQMDYESLQKSAEKADRTLHCDGIDKIDLGVKRTCFSLDSILKS